MQFSSFTYIHTVVQPTSRTFPILQNWNSVPIKQLHGPPPSPEQPPLHFVSLKLTTSDASHMYFVLLWLACFIHRNVPEAHPGWSMGWIAFFFLNNISLHILTHHILFIHPFPQQTLGLSCHLLATVKWWGFLKYCQSHKQKQALILKCTAQILGNFLYVYGLCIFSLLWIVCSYPLTPGFIPSLYPSLLLLSLELFSNSRH